MLLIRTLALCLLVLLMGADGARAGGHVFLFSTDTDVITVLDSDDLSPVTTLAGTRAAREVIASPDGKKYYVISSKSTETILVVDVETLTITKRISLGANPRVVEMTPDGRYLLIAAGSLRVLDVETDQEIGAGIAVGQGPTDIVVDNPSAKAYVLADGGDVISVIDLSTLTVEQVLNVADVTSIALTPDDFRLLAVSQQGLRNFRTADLEEISSIDAKTTIVGGEILPFPNSTQAFARNSSGRTPNTSEIFDLDLRSATIVGDVGAERFVEVMILSNERAIGLFNRTGELGDIDLTTNPAAVEIMPFAENTRNITLSPNKRFLFAASRKDASVTKIDLESDTIVASVNVPIAPARHATVFGPSQLPPALITVNGGDNQFIPPDIVVPVAISVKVTDEEGSPIAGVPVLFAAESSPLEVLIEPAGSGLTNILGVASAVVTIPPIPPPVEEGEEETEGASLPDAEVTELAASEGDATEETALSASAVEPEPVDQEVDVIEPIVLTARTVGLDPALIQLNLIRATGIIKVGGDFQVTAPLEDFREPFKVLVTDETGLPLPPGTNVNFNAFQARCQFVGVPTDANGFAEVKCSARALSQGAGTQRSGQVIATVPDFLELGFARFTLSVALGANLITMVKVSGDGQAAPAGEPLPEPLRFFLGLNFGGSGDVGIRISQLSGPVVNLNPTFLTTPSGFIQSIQVTLGPNAGNVVIQAEALSPKAPSVTFNITATGGLPESFQIEGNGQRGRVGKELAMPLRMRVINESGGVVPFPEVSWVVVEGAATLITATDPDGATARVVMGDVPGAVKVSASIAGLTAVFDLTATPPEPVSISTVSGQNQILAAGDLSEPLIAQVNEIDNVPASNVVVEFSGPNFVVLHPLDGSPPGNPVSQVTGPDGQAAVRVELPIVAGVSLGPGSNDQFSRTISIVATVDNTLSTTFVLGSIGRTPSFVSGGIVNAATFQAGIVPGSLASLFGEGLSEGISATVLTGGATSFEGTTVLIGGIPSPLLSITGSPVEQINLQVPFELATGTTTTIEVENNGTRTTVGGVPVFSTQPGIFEIPDPAGGTVGAVIDARTGAAITQQNPAARDRPLSVFFTGGGALQPTVLTGVFGPVPPAVMTETVVVGVDDKGAEILFQGYAPGFLGLYQVNFDLPEDAGCGVRNLVIRVGGSFSLDSKTVIQCP